jgi:hypothetical protein
LVAVSAMVEPIPLGQLPKRYMPPLTADAVIAMYEAMVGRPMTQEQKIAIRAKYAAIEARRMRDKPK